MDQPPTVLVALVDGVATPDIRECGMLWKSGQIFRASAVFLGGRWAIAAQHSTTSGTAADYHVSLPIEFLSDLRPENSFRVEEIVPVPNEDLALLRLAPDPSAAPKPAPPLRATVEEFEQADSVKLCGFGSNDCDQTTGAGTKRISLPKPIVADPLAKNLAIAPLTQFAVDAGGTTPLTCLSDSGGGVYIIVGGTLKLTGIIDATVRDAQNNAYTRCIRLQPFLEFIRQTTHLPL